MSRSCASDPYRCATIERLLSQERMDNLDYQVYMHATEARRPGVPYRIDETSSAANRGAPGVSDVAASAVWTLDTMFSAACPQPPDAPAANADCHVGAIGVNFHNSEVRPTSSRRRATPSTTRSGTTRRPRGSADPRPPSYYAMFLFARFAQGTTGLRPVAMEVTAERDRAPGRGG